MAAVPSDADSCGSGCHLHTVHLESVASTFDCHTFHVYTQSNVHNKFYICF